MGQSQFSLQIGDHADDTDAGTGVVGGGRVAYRNHLLDVVLFEKEVDRLIQLFQFFLDVKDLKRAGKGFDFDHCSPPVSGGQKGLLSLIFYKTTSLHFKYESVYC
jgi:hypothetical protein